MEAGDRVVSAALVRSRPRKRVGVPSPACGRGRAPAPPAHAYRRAGASTARPPLLGGLRQSLAGPGGWSAPGAPSPGRHWLRHPGPHHLLPPRSGRAAAAAASGGGAARRRPLSVQAGECGARGQEWRGEGAGRAGSRGREPSTPSPPQAAPSGFSDPLFPFHGKASPIQDYKPIFL